MFCVTMSVGYHAELMVFALRFLVFGTSDVVLPQKGVASRTASVLGDLFPKIVKFMKEQKISCNPLSVSYTDVCLVGEIILFVSVSMEFFCITWVEKPFEKFSAN